MKKVVLILSALALLGSLGACGDAAAAARQATGLRSNSITVSQVLEDAAATEAPTETAVPLDTERPRETTRAITPEQTQDGFDMQNSDIDIDLTQLNSTMIYSEVYSMMVEPEAFLGKTVRLAGYCASGYYEPTDTTYYAVVIPDATACCAQGIEYILADGAAYPADDTDIVITGTFEMYEELGIEYCRLGNATINAECLSTPA